MAYSDNITHEIRHTSRNTQSRYRITKVKLKRLKKLLRYQAASLGGFVLARAFR